MKIPLFFTLTLNNEGDFGDERLLNEVILGLAAEHRPVVRRLGPELVTVPRAVAHRRVGGVSSLSVAVPRDSGEGVAAVRHAHQGHRVALAVGLAAAGAQAFYFRGSRRV
jgi:hypothetical protein